MSRLLKVTHAISTVFAAAYMGVSLLSLWLILFGAAPRVFMPFVVASAACFSISCLADLICIRRTR